MPPIFPEEPGDPTLRLEQWHHGVQVHAIDPLHFKSDVIAEDVGNAEALC
jgi:hypothetical protein